MVKSPGCRLSQGTKRNLAATPRRIEMAATIKMRTSVEIYFVKMLLETKNSSTADVKEKANGRALKLFSTGC
jgi:hypothetical protein